MKQPARDWKEAVRVATAGLPVSVRSEVEAAATTGGVVPPATVDAWCASLGQSVDELMTTLLPVASAAAHPPISSFYVGAVAAAHVGSGLALYLGANLEFAGATLMASIHAEQSAVLRAWQDGAERLHGIATSAAPCGHCRQFLHEVRAGRDEVVVITPQGRVGLSALLPSAFGPDALRSQARMLEPPTKDLSFVGEAPREPLWTEALAAAARSYTPYSGSAAGIAVQLRGGGIVTGQACENAAFNPSVSPLQTAAAAAGARIFDSGAIESVVMVEELSAVSHRARDGSLLGVLAPGIELSWREVAASR